MQPFLPGSVHIEVKWRGNGLPCQLNMIQGEGSLPTSIDLDLVALKQASGSLEMDEMLDHGQYGQALFNLLFPQPLRDEFFRQVGQAGENGLRISLDFDPDAQGIHTIPWERMYFPRHESLFPLAVEPSIVFSRLLKTISPEAAPRSSGR